MKKWGRIPAVLKPRERMKRAKGSSTPGRSKKANCVASPEDRTMARRSRSYHTPGYATWCEKMDRKN